MRLTETVHLILEQEKLRARSVVSSAFCKDMQQADDVLYNCIQSISM